MVGERAHPTLKEKVSAATRRLWPFKKQTHPPTIGELFTAAARRHFPKHPQLLEALKLGLPPLSEHEQIFSLVSAMNRDISTQIADGIASSIDQASFHGLFDSISAALAQQFVLLPYYFAMFHQNKERRLLRQLTGQVPPPASETEKVALFTDPLDEVNGVCRFIRDIAAQAQRHKRRLSIFTCSPASSALLPGQTNFQPLGSYALPCYPQIRLHLPPLLDIMKRAEEEQFDVIHVSTPGPMGLCGWLVAKMLRAPLLGTYHTDFPAYGEHLTSDARIARGVAQYIQWFYGRMDRVLARSRTYRASLVELGIGSTRIGVIPPAIDQNRFQVAPAIPQRPGRTVLYVGRLSVEKNLPLLVDVFKKLRTRRSDVTLVMAGDGPYREQLQQQLGGLPVRFLGTVPDDQLPALYGSSDLLLFPSRTDTLGQVVMEAQACGLPVLVSDEGGPQELTDDGVTGRVISARDADAWAAAIDDLLNDEPLRQRMSRSAAQRASRFSMERCFEQFWNDHLAAISDIAADAEIEPSCPPSNFATS